MQLYWSALAYMPVGVPVVKRTVEEMLRLDFANEFFLISVVPIGAFAIGEYAELVAVMLFYDVGELFQENAVDRARGISKPCLILGMTRPRYKRGNDWVTIKPEVVNPGEYITVRPGEEGIISVNEVTLGIICLLLNWLLKELRSAGN